MVEKKTGLDWVLDILNTALLILIGLACLYPFWYVVCASFSDANEFLRHDFVLLLKPLKFSLEAYQYCITDRILVGYRNTLFYVVAGTAISMGQIIPQKPTNHTGSIQRNIIHSTVTI